MVECASHHYFMFGINPKIFHVTFEEENKLAPFLLPICEVSFLYLSLSFFFPCAKRNQDTETMELHAIVNYGDLDSKQNYFSNAKDVES